MKTLKESNFQDATFWFNSWAANPDNGTTKEDLMKPAYWAHIAPKLRPGDLIQVRAEDGSYFAILIVKDRGRTWAKVEDVLFKDMTAHEFPEMATQDGEFSVKWAGPTAKFRVTRTSDKAVMKDGFANKADADRWILDYQKALTK